MYIYNYFITLRRFTLRCSALDEAQVVLTRTFLGGKFPSSLNLIPLPESIGEKKVYLYFFKRRERNN